MNSLYNDALIQKLSASVQLFQGFNHEEVRDFLGHCRIETQPAGLRLIEEGQPGDCLYIILSGSVAILRHADGGERELARLGPSETFGELALLDHGPRSASVMVCETARLLVYRRSGMLWTHAEAAKLYRNLAMMLATRLREADALLARRQDAPPPPL